MSSALDLLLGTLVKKLQELNEVVLRLKEPSYSLIQARAYLDFILVVFKTIYGRLNPTARIVHNANFERRIEKNMGEKEDDLTTVEGSNCGEESSSKLADGQRVRSDGQQTIGAGCGTGIGST